MSFNTIKNLHLTRKTIIFWKRCAPNLCLLQLFLSAFISVPRSAFYVQYDYSIENSLKDSIKYVHPKGYMKGKQPQNADLYNLVEKMTQLF